MEEKFTGGGSIADQNEMEMEKSMHFFGCLFLSGVALLVAVVGWIIYKIFLC